MPKELIHDDAREIGKDNSSPFAVEVSWGRESQYVSVASVNLQNGDGEQRYTSDYGWHTTFPNRSHVNQLIRVLRKARDQAFGPDE